MKRKIWNYWILAHTFAFPLALLVGFIAIHLFSFIGNLLPEIIASGLGYILWGGIIGCAIGLTQWYFLKKINIPSGWIWRSGIGFVIAETIGVLVLLMMDVDRNIDLVDSYGLEVWTLIYFVGGAISGYLQSHYLKNNFASFRFWILANSLIWGISTLIWTALIRFIPSGGGFMAISGGLFLGLLSSLVLSHILKNGADHKV
jgi:hypothetical protein